MLARDRNRGLDQTNWYRDSLGSDPVQRPALLDSAACDVCVVGAGFTGLGAALELARQGANVVVLEAAHIGSGGSGRNGGQVHPGQRQDPEWMERRLGEPLARQLWDLAEAAREHLRTLIRAEGIDCDWLPGLLHVHHRAGQDRADAAHVVHLRQAYGYDLLEPLDRTQVATRLGSQAYRGGVLDRGGGHLHPLKLCLGLADLAERAGARIFERSTALKIRPERRSGAAGFRINTLAGDVLAREVILSGDGYGDGLRDAVDARVMPISNFIAVTEPLDAPEILPGLEAGSDSRFVINYFRRTLDGRLLFGGGETYGLTDPVDIAAFVRPHIEAVYPQLGGIGLTHAWGGAVGVTRQRMPFVRQIEPGLWIASGYSGQGVMLAPYVGKLLAQAALGSTSAIQPLLQIPVPPFPGGRHLRSPLLMAGMSWFALRDRIG